MYRLQQHQQAASVLPHSARRPIVVHKATLCELPELAPPPKNATTVMASSARPFLKSAIVEHRWARECRSKILIHCCVSVHVRARVCACAYVCASECAPLSSLLVHLDAICCSPTSPPPTQHVRTLTYHPAQPTREYQHRFSESQRSVHPFACPTRRLAGRMQQFESAPPQTARPCKSRRRVLSIAPVAQHHL